MAGAFETMRLLATCFLHADGDNSAAWAFAMSFDRAWPPIASQLPLV